MKLPLVRRATADALRAQLARAEQDAAANAADLKGELHDAQLASAGAKAAYDVANSRAVRAEKRVTKLQHQLRALQPAQDEAATLTGTDQTSVGGYPMSDRQYGLHVLTRVFSMFHEVIKKNDGTLTDDNYKALSIYVTNAPTFGVTDDEIESLRVAHGIPAAVIEKAKNLVQPV